MQTHTTPVLLGFKDRAELAGGEYTSLTSVMEGVVIVQKVEQPSAPAAGTGNGNGNGNGSGPSSTK